MERKFVANIKPNERIDEIFLVKFKQLRTARNGSHFIHMELADRTGTLIARKWRASEALYATFSDGDLVRVKGSTELYQERLQLIVDSIEQVSRNECDIADFLPHTEKDVEVMWERLKEILRSVENTFLSSLIEAFVEDASFKKNFIRAPAAVDYHHAYLGGLLEHTLSILELGVEVAEHYTELDRDILLSGIFLHDIGKITELSYDGSFTYTDEGRLVGHIVRGVEMMQEKASTIDDFPKPLLDVLRHIILSHHGEYEFGSPRLPMTAEAMAVHHLDNLDAKVNAVSHLIASHPDRSSHWTDWAKMFQRRLFRGIELKGEEPPEL